MVLIATLYNALGIFIAVGIGVITFFKWRYNYWKTIGLPTTKPTAPFGDLKPVISKKRHMGEALQDIYNYAKSKGYKHIGAYAMATPIYVPVDPELIKHIMLKDFDHFMDRGVYYNEKYDPVSAHLFALSHEKWKLLRQKLTPTFSSGQLKSMFETIANSAKNLEDFMNLQSSGTPLDIRDVCARFTTDTIGSCAFGIECNTLKDPDAEFRKYGKLAFEQTLMEQFKTFILTVSNHNFLKTIGFKFTKPEVASFFMTAVKEMVEYRETHDVHRKDFMDLLLQLKKQGRLNADDEVSEFQKKVGSPTLTIEEMAAQAFVFYIGGFETSSSTMTYTLFELALNQDIQDKVRKEINAVLEKHNGEVTYESVMEMQYLKCVLDEALRKYPPVPLLNRVCTTDYKIPDSNVIIKKNTEVIIPILGLQRDPDYYPNPDVFNPDRFLKENKNSRPPFTYLPFGDGPRNCIGLRFGLLQIKIGLITMLRDRKVILNTQTILPLEMDARSWLILINKNTIWLDVTNAN